MEEDCSHHQHREGGRRTARQSGVQVQVEYPPVRLQENLGLSPKNREECRRLLRNFIPQPEGEQITEDFLSCCLPEHGRVVEGQGDSQPPHMRDTFDPAEHNYPGPN
jgi:hypothetical protein